MTEILNLMKCFPDSVIRSNSEVTLDSKGNVSFSVHSGMTREEILAKIFEWCSRSCAKGCPYSNGRSNDAWRNSLILKFDKYIGKVFDQTDFYWIYDQLGNAINHEKTLRFIREGMDVGKLLEEDDTKEE